MGGASSPDPTTAPFESGMLRLAPQSRHLLRSMLRLLPTLLPLSALPLGLMTAPPRRGTYLHRTPSNILFKTVLICLHHQIQMVGSRTQGVPYYIGYPKTVVSACIHLLFSQYLLHPIFGPFLLISKTLLLEPPGPRFQCRTALASLFCRIHAYRLVN